MTHQALSVAAKMAFKMVCSCWKYMSCCCWTMANWRCMFWILDLVELQRGRHMSLRQNSTIDCCEHRKEGFTTKNPSGYKHPFPIL